MDQKTAELLIVIELDKATETFGAFASAHEGYAILIEETDELWEAIKSKHATVQEQRNEAVQVAAMALRFLIDLC